MKVQIEQPPAAKMCSRATFDTGSVSVLSAGSFIPDLTSLIQILWEGLILTIENETFNIVISMEATWCGWRRMRSPFSFIQIILSVDNLEWNHLAHYYSGSRLTHINMGWWTWLIPDMDGWEGRPAQPSKDDDEEDTGDRVQVEQHHGHLHRIRERYDGPSSQPPL